MFYECYNDDALACQEVLGITPTKRGDVQVVGFPESALDDYMILLVKSGKKLATVKSVWTESGTNPVTKIEPAIINEE